MDELKLPPHIVKISDKWFQNLETDKYISKDHIDAVCERYWLAMAKKTSAVKAKISYKKTFKSAQRRWENDI